MEKLIHPGILIALLVVLAAGTFGGLAVAHDGGDQTENDCEMNHADDECEMTHGEEDCLMRGSGMMGMNGDVSDIHQGC